MNSVNLKAFYKVKDRLKTKFGTVFLAYIALDRLISSFIVF